MGAGASSDGGELEQLVACTYLLGQALASMSFPDMYRIQDFHADDAPARPGGYQTRYQTSFEDAPRGAGVVLHNLVEISPDRYAARPAFAQIRFPRRPPLRSVRGLEADREAAAAAPFDYGARFHVQVSGERVVVDDVDFQNDDGWTPLHACCHNHQTVAAALDVLREMRSRGSSLERRTTRGPGAHQSGWTALYVTERRSCPFGGVREGRRHKNHL